MYADVNTKTKKALKEAVASGLKISVFQPNNMFGVEAPPNGTCAVEGPWYPKPHTWYATVTLENGVITKVK
jgi:hypothetical protein